MRRFITILLLLIIVIDLQASPESQPGNPEVESIYQFFAPTIETNPRPNLGAYLWIPPNTPKIRAVMVGIHNALTINILQSASVRAICRKHGIAQILMTPYAKDIGSVMLRDLTFDVSDPERTAVYDGYLQRLADAAGHPELISAPIVPLAHSAFCDFPFNAAMRKPEQCLGAMPIKAGLPDVYSFYAAGGKAKTPNPNLCLRHVPILFVNSASQETVGWSAYPHGIGAAGLGSYRRDHDDNPGTGYEPRNEMFGMCWEMMSGHFDMLPRNYQFVADWLDAVALARLPAKVGEPLKNLALRDGWLMDPQIPTSGELPPNYAPPAPYPDYKGPRQKALWFPNEKLARALFESGRDEPRREIEMFTFLDPSGQPISLAHNTLAVMPDASSLLRDDGIFTLTTHHFTAPFEVCTVKDKEHAKHPEQPHVMENILFPGKAVLPSSSLPLRFDPSGSPVELVKTEAFKDGRGVNETRFTLKLKRNRMYPDAGFTMFFCRGGHEGNPQFAAAGRTCQIAWSVQDIGKDAAPQTVDFPPVPNTPASTGGIKLNATSSARLPVDYFVLKGPGIIQNGAFVPKEMPAGMSKPIEVTVGAYQAGVYKESGGVKTAKTVYQTFQLTP